MGPGGLAGALGNPDAVAAIVLSMYAALLATVISLILGLPLAYLLARRDFPGKALVESVVDLPVVVPHTVAGISILMVFGRRGVIGAPLGELGFRLADSLWGIVAAMLFVSLPFFINAAREGFESVDPRLENVAMGLGATRVHMLFTVTLPLSARSILMGGIMAWARAISEFGAVVLIAYFPMTAPVYIFTEYNQYGLEAAAPAAALLLVVSLSVFISLRLIARRWKRFDTS